MTSGNNVPLTPRAIAALSSVISKSNRTILHLARTTSRSSHSRQTSPIQLQAVVPEEGGLSMTDQGQVRREGPSSVPEEAERGAGASRPTGTLDSVGGAQRPPPPHRFSLTGSVPRTWPTLMELAGGGKRTGSSRLSSGSIIRQGQPGAVSAGGASPSHEVSASDIKLHEGLSPAESGRSEGASRRRVTHDV
jgi:hypothetical protein